MEHFRGRKFTLDELHEGVDLETFIGSPCKLLIFHNETEERVYANIESVVATSGQVTKKAKTSSRKKKTELNGTL